MENGKKYNIIVTSVKNGFESEDSEIFTFTSTTSSLKEEAVATLSDWININYNDSTYDKIYKQKIGNYYFTVMDNSISCADFSPNEGSYYIHIKLSNSQYSGTCSMEKEKNIASGNIIKSSSNKLELTYDSYESDYSGDKNVILKKFVKAVEDTLILFDSFLKENNIGLTLKDFGFDYELPEKSIKQSVTFEALRDFILYYQESTNSDKAEVVKTIEDSNGSTQYSMLYDNKKDIIKLTNTRIYKGSYTYSSIDLTPDKQSYQCSFSFYYPENKSNTPDFEATYIIDAKTFGENSNINFENVKGNKANANSYKEIGKLMNLDLLDYIDYVFSLADFAEFSTADFGFNLI